MKKELFFVAFVILAAALILHIYFNILNGPYVYPTNTIKLASPPFGIQVTPDKNLLYFVSNSSLIQINTTNNRVFVNPIQIDVPSPQASL